MSIDLVSFRQFPYSCTADRISFQIDPTEITWLPNVDAPLEPETSFRGLSGGPCFRILATGIELAGFIYEGDWTNGVIFARQASLISAIGKIAPKPL